MLVAVILSASGCGGGDESTGAFLVDARSGDMKRVGAGEPLGWAGRSVVLLDGDTVRTVTSDGEERSAARLPIRSQSDDVDDVAGYGDRVAFVTTATTPGGPPRGALVVQRADGSNRRILARRVSGTPVFSADGRKVAVSVASSSRPLVAAVDGRSVSTLAVKMTAIASAKGQGFIGQQQRGDTGGRRLVVSDGRKSRTLLGSWTGGTVSPAPDGQTAVVSDLRSLQLVDLTTGRRRDVQLTKDLYPSFRFAWTADGTRFAGANKGTLAVWKADGTAPNKLTDLQGRIILLGLWDGDRTRIAVEVRDEPEVGQ